MRSEDGKVKGKDEGRTMGGEDGGRKGRWEMQGEKTMELGPGDESQMMKWDNGLGKLPRYAPG